MNTGTHSNQDTIDYCIDYQIRFQINWVHMTQIFQE